MDMLAHLGCTTKRVVLLIGKDRAGHGHGYDGIPPGDANMHLNDLFES